MVSFPFPPSICVFVVNDIPVKSHTLATPAASYKLLLFTVSQVVIISTLLPARLNVIGMATFVVESVEQRSVSVPAPPSITGSIPSAPL